MAESANRKGNLLISKHRRGDEGIYGLSPGLVRFLNEFVIAKLYPWAARCFRTAGLPNRTGLTFQCSVALTTFFGPRRLAQRQGLTP